MILKLISRLKLNKPKQPESKFKVGFQLLKKSITMNTED